MRQHLQCSCLWQNGLLMTLLLSQSVYQRDGDINMISIQKKSEASNQIRGVENVT